MTKSFHELDPDAVRKLLEGHENVIKPAVERELSFFRSIPCPACQGTETEARINPKRPFVKGSILPNKLLHCLHCGAEFEPDTKLISKPPTISSG